MFDCFMLTCMMSINKIMDLLDFCDGFYKLNLLEEWAENIYILRN